jgi:hypothetical protein
MTITGRKLNREWNVGAEHSLYRYDGKWYHILVRFPGALFDASGYILFETHDIYEKCKHLRINYESKTTHVSGEGIREIPGYIRKI